ncbi:unnamed protein product [Phaeothamnion confervicola]
MSRYFVILFFELLVAVVDAVFSHAEKVANVSAAVAARPNGSLLTLQRKPGESHRIVRDAYKRDTHRIDISALSDIVSVDLESETVVAEGRVTMQQLVRQLLPTYGRVPCVVPEFRHITVGGAAQGGAAESTSRSFGFFHDVVFAYEVVLGNGTVVNTARDGEHAALHHGLPATYGTLGILTAATLQLCRAEPFVRLELRRWNSAAAAASYLTRPDPPDEKLPDFAEGIGFADDFFMTVEGRYAVAAEAKGRGTSVRRFDGFLSPWFYKVVEREGQRLLAKIGGNVGGGENNDPSGEGEARRNYRTKNGKASTIFYTPTEDYFFRHDRGAFWMVGTKLPHALGRVLGPLLSSRKLMKVAAAFPKAVRKRTMLVQDFVLPAENAPAFVRHLSVRLRLWPLWLLPIRNRQSAQTLLAIPAPADDRSFFVNVGAYGEPQNRENYTDFRRANRELELLLTSLGGRKAFYAHAFYPREEFEALYNMTAYDDVREAYSAVNVFPDVFDKVVVPLVDGEQLVGNHLGEMEQR